MRHRVSPQGCDRSAKAGGSEVEGNFDGKSACPCGARVLVPVPELLCVFLSADSLLEIFIVDDVVHGS
jgi:hypothetical protein